MTIPQKSYYSLINNGMIASFCCNDIDGHKSILYVDVTFQLGSIFVLVTSYQNPTLYMKNSSALVCPVLLGPIMLCMLKDNELYITLFQKMSACIPGFKVYLQAYCTDGEKALREALGREFERFRRIRVQNSRKTER